MSIHGITAAPRAHIVFPKAGAPLGGDPRGDLAQVARDAGASPRTPARLSRSEPGMAFTHWRTRLHLVECIELLACGASVMAVALDLGYGAPSAWRGAFLKSGAPTPEGLTMIGRWHAPGSASGWAVVEGDDPSALAEHVAEWADLLELQVTPVLEDDGAAQAISRVYGQ
jgi:AraC-like DNA-binding protein